MEDIRVSTSGAYITRLGDYVVKAGDGDVGKRIGAQAKWLMRYAGEGLMPVYGLIGDFGYVMPYGEEAYPDGVNAREHFDTTVSLLMANVWNYGPEYDATQRRDDILRKLFSMIERVGVPHVIDLYSVMNTVQWDELHRCLTHGDPTFCNVMTVRGTHVLCDPLPSTQTHLPDIRAMDLGKVLQSCFGFETIVYGWRYSEPPNPLWVRDFCDNDNEWNASLACAALHVLRLLPYVGDQFREEFLRVFDEMLRLRS